MKKWCVAQVYSGSEQLVCDDLKRRIAAADESFQELFGRVEVPSAEVKSIGPADEMKDQKLFPGYLLVEMEVTPETMRFVMDDPKALRFLGGDNPAILSEDEVMRVFSQVEVGITVKAPTGQFNIGSEVDIKDGPFAGFVGVIDKVDEENERLSVMVSIFGRLTPVELRYDQIKR